MMESSGGLLLLMFAHIREEESDNFERMPLSFIKIMLSKLLSLSKGLCLP